MNYRLFGVGFYSIFYSINPKSTLKLNHGTIAQVLSEALVAE